MQLQLGVPDKHIWCSKAQANTQLFRFTMLYFKVLLVMVLGSASGNLGHPENAVSSSGWLLIIAFWTANCLAQRGLPVPHLGTCQFSDQQSETIQHPIGHAFLPGNYSIFSAKSQACCPIPSTLGEFF